MARLLLLTVSLALTAFAAVGPAFSARGDCCQPVSDGSLPIASDCLFMLRAAVGLAACDPECICAPKGSLPTTASDALICLKAAVGQSVSLACPCGPSTTTTTLFVPRECGDFEAKLGEGRLSEPHGVAVDEDGNIYVADSGSDKIVKLDAAGRHLKSWGGPGTATGKLLDPRGIAVGPNGRVYVADNGNYRIQVFSDSGAFITAWGSFCFVSQGTGCVDPDGSGPLETGDGQFVEPYGVAVDGAGDVYVTDASNQRIQVFDSAGAFERKWPVAGVPRNLAVGGGTVFTNPGDHTIATFTTDGAPGPVFSGFCRLQDGSGCVDRDGPGPLESGDGQIFQFLGLLAHTNESLFVVDDGNRRVQWLRDNGAFRTKWGSECCLSDGVGCVDPDGAGPLESGDGQFCSPTGVALTPSGDVLVADLNARVQRFACPDLR